MKKEALLYKKLEENTVECFLCAHNCKIPDTKFGFCGVRQNISGELFTYAYAEVIAAHVDPIEKKPLYHFLPGQKSFSISTIGCNFRCSFCQNWQISQQSFLDPNHLSGEVLKPEKVVDLAIKNNCQSISYTYTEPTIFFEFAQDIGRLAKSKGLFNNFVTNGYMSQNMLFEARDWLDAANVDLKFFNDQSYKKVCAGSLKPVLDSIRLMHELGIWVEVTTLIVPGENDSDGELRGIADFLASVDKDIPWHISRFHPDYKLMDYKATPESILKKALEIGKSAGLKYIYVGNVYGWGNDTICPSCQKTLIKREVFSITENRLDKGHCPFCKEKVAGVF